jgi:hypothetical protein
MCLQYLHHVDIGFLPITWQVHTYLFAPLHYPSNRHGSYFYKLTSFDVIEFFFPYGLLTLKTICDLTSFYYSKTFPPSHIHKEQTQKKIIQEKT